MSLHRLALRVRPSVGLALAAAVLVLAGCRIFTSPGHDTLTLQLDADVSTSVRVITSNSFSIMLEEDGSESFLLLQADTAWVQVPFTQDYDLRQRARLYVRVAEAEQPDALITMRILLDGRSSYTDTNTIQGVGIQYYYVGG
jgi:hypothetical protein